MVQSKRPLYAKIKEEVFKRDQYTCQYCGRKFSVSELGVDHIIPLSHGGNSEPDNLVKACMECNCTKANRSLKDYLIDAIKSNTEYYRSFNNGLENLKGLLDILDCEESIKQVSYRLIYSNIITVMETYLSDAFINTVTKDKLLVRRFVELDPEFQKRKINVSEIYLYLDKLEDIVREYLLEIIYHNIWVIKNMYKCVLNIDFPEDMAEINSAVMMRHDIVHRNGKHKKTGEIHILTKEKILTCIDDVAQFINYIDNQLKILDSSKLGDSVKKVCLE